MSLALALVLVPALAPPAAPADHGAGEPVEFTRQIRPLLSGRCFPCHGPDGAAREAGLRLDLRGEAALRVLSPGAPGESALLARVGHADSAERMPPAWSNKPALGPEEIALLERWIAEGATYDEHWAWRPLERPPAPRLARSDWPAGEIDRFVLAGLAARGLAPAPDADRVTLARRLHLDLTGLPPAPEEVERFLADESPIAWERLVERLLASPHFGERMALFWLDLVRYADSAGYHSDPEITVWPYRDWVVRAFADNLPFDRQAVEQLAGDLLPGATLEQRVASTYNRLNKTTDEGGAQPGEYLVKHAADRVRTTSGAWMGVTLGCAECHDHKYDPFTARDFYRFAAFFADVEEVGVYPNNRRPPFLAVPSAADRREMARLAAELEALDPADPRSTELAERIERLSAGAPQVLATVATEPRAVRVLPRGNWLDESGPAVEPGVPAFLGRIEGEGARATRLDLARWLVDPANPLTPRVLANRLWALFFGTGLSARLDDVGAQGEPPSHPELLDWLAAELVESGWDVKHLVRQIVGSRAYRQSSLPRPELRDPRNRLLARQARFRLPAEHVRDAILAVAGLLNRELGGPSVKPYQPEGYWDHLNFPARKYVPSSGAALYKRGLYVHRQRTFPHPSLLAFDAPPREECTAQRPISNTPSGALALLNDPSYVEAARVFAASLLAEAQPDEGARLTLAFRRALSREPEERELEVLRALLASQREHFAARPADARALLATGEAPLPETFDAAELAAWTSVARALLNLGETITRS